MEVEFPGGGGGSGVHSRQGNSVCRGLEAGLSTDVPGPVKGLGGARDGGDGER